MKRRECVGALVRDGRNRVYVHRRSPTRRLLPGVWDLVGGHVEPGETPEQALAREIEEETGWRLRRIEALLCEWQWEHDGIVRTERDYLVEVDGDLAAPRLEEGKHDACAWVGADNLDLLLVGRGDGDRRLRDVVAKAVRTRLTQRLRLEPIRPEHAADLWLVHSDAHVAAWYGGGMTREEAVGAAGRMARRWEAEGVHRWLAYERGGATPAGRGGVYRAEVDGQSVLSLGWALRSPYRGRGLATEIGRAGLAYAFEEVGAGQVVAFTERHNQRSRAVMERLGMRFDREFLRRGLVEGRGVRDEAPFVLYVARRPGE